MSDPVRVVLDCDTGVDDTMAIFYGLLSPGIDVVGISTVWGNTTVENTTQNTLRLLEIVNQPSVPVAMGAAKPLLGPLPRLAGGVHGSDGQGNTNLPPPSLKATGEHAADQIIRLAHEHPNELILVPTGPMTNVGLALAKDPEIARLYRAIVLMGGAFQTPGNVTGVAEANIWHDPEAAQTIFDAVWPITVVGLDVTHQVRLTEPLRQQLNDSGTPAGRHLYRIVDHYFAAYERRWGRRESAMHDALALGIAFDPSLMVRAPKGRVDVELTGTHTRGMTVADLRPHAPPERANATVPLEVDAARFLDRWMEIMCGSARNG
jgi:purine nucleosidase